MKYIKNIILFLITLMLISCSQQIQSVNIKKILSQANNGNAIAQNNLGSYYQFGDIKNIPIDYKKSVEWYKKSAAQGLPIAKVNLGYMYDEGLGIQKNKKKAILLYKEAANASNPRGMINLAEMYRTGDNIEQSNIKAFMWLDIARFYTQHTKDMRAKWAARGALDKVKEKMSIQEINEGKELSRDWINKKRR